MAGSAVRQRDIGDFDYFLLTQSFATTLGQRLAKI